MNYEEYKALIATLKQHNINYYTLDAPTITDAEYDKLYDQLVEFEEANPKLVDVESPTKQVGSKLKEGLGFKKHTVRLYSLDKVKSGREKEIKTKLLDKIDNSEVVVEWKYDGLTIVLAYQEGKFKEARSRGDGIEGEILTDAIKQIKGVPMEIPYLEPLEIQGEVLVSKSGLLRYNQKQNEKMEAALKKAKTENEKRAAINKYPQLKNARNAAAGSIRQLDMNVVRERPLDIFFYNVLVSSENFKKQTDMFVFLKKNGFKVNQQYETAIGLKQIEEIIKSRAAIKESLDFEVDGLTIKANNLEYKKLGHTEKFPRYCLSYKFETIEVISKLKNVEWLVGRTGVVTPRAEIEPVLINGTTVSRATLNNFSVIQNKKLRLNAEIYVRKTGEVIPEITGAVNIGEGESIYRPTNCPVCNSYLRYEDPFVICDNDECEAKVLKKWEHFLSKPAMDIKGLSTKTIDKLITNGMLNHFEDIFHLTYAQLLTIEGFEQKSAANLLAEIQSKKEKELATVIYSFGIKEVGKVTTRKITEKFPTWEQFKNATKEELLIIDDVGPVVAENIITWLRNKENIDTAEKVLAQLKIKEHLKVTNGPLLGKTYVITGKFGDLKRSEMKKTIETLGGKVADNITQDVDVLVCGEKAGSKLDKAQAFGIKIINKEEFLKKITSLT